MTLTYKMKVSILLNFIAPVGILTTLGILCYFVVHLFICFITWEVLLIWTVMLRIFAAAGFVGGVFIGYQEAHHQYQTFARNIRKTEQELKRTLKS
jgi:hypothetical protein